MAGHFSRQGTAHRRRRSDRLPGIADGASKYFAGLVLSNMRLYYYKGFEKHCLESWDPDYQGPASARETVGHDIEPITCPAFRTVSRQQAEQALLEYFDTGTLPRCIRWAWVEDDVTPVSSWQIL